MGWTLKILAFLFALFAFSLGAWIVGVPILLLLFLPLIKREPSPAGREYREYRERPPVERSHAPLRHLVAGLFFVLAVIARVSGGTLSPVALASLGVVTLFWGRMGGTSFVSSVRPVNESIAMRSPLPLFYFAVVELKLTNREVAKVLSSLNGHLVIVAGERPSVLVVLRCLAFGVGHAESRLVKKVRTLVDLAVPLGAYPLPLDGEQVAAIMKERDHLKLRTETLMPSLASASLQALSVEVEDGFVKSIAAYGRVRGRGASILPAKQSVRQVVFWEVMRELSRKMTWPNPDQHSAFLASLFASKGAALGERIIDAGGSGTSIVLVRSTGSAAVELSRAQLRSIVRVYDQA